MDNLKFACPVCRVHLEAEVGMAGQTFACPNCGTTVKAPIPATGPSEPVAAAALPASEVNGIRTSAAAVWSMILGILCAACPTALTSVPALICGHIALKRIRIAKGTLKGRDMALSGLILGYLYLAVFLTVIVILAGGASCISSKARSKRSAPAFPTLSPSAPLSPSTGVATPPAQHTAIPPLGRPQAVDAGQTIGDLVRSRDDNVEWAWAGMPAGAIRCATSANIFGAILSDGTRRPTTFVAVWRLDDGHLLVKAATEVEDPIQSLALSSDGRLLALGTQAGLVHVWNTRSGEKVQTMNTQEGRVVDLLYADENAVLVTAHATKWGHHNGYGMTLLDPQTGTRIGRFLQGLHVYGLAASPDSRHVLVLAQEARRRADITDPQLWNVQEGTVLASFGSGRVRGATVAPDYSHIVLARDFARAACLDVATQKEVRVLTLGDGQTGVWPESLSFSQDQLLLAASNGEGSTFLHQAGDGRLVRILPESAGHAVFSADSRHLVISGKDGIRVVDLARLFARQPVVKGVVQITGCWKSDRGTEGYFAFRRSRALQQQPHLDGWIRGPEWTGELASANAPILAANGKTTLDVDWSRGDQSGSGRLEANPDGTQIQCMFWEGTLRRGPAAVTVTLRPRAWPWPKTSAGSIDAASGGNAPQDVGLRPAQPPPPKESRSAPSPVPDGSVRPSAEGGRADSGAGAAVEAETPPKDAAIRNICARLSKQPQDRGQLQALDRALAELGEHERRPVYLLVHALGSLAAGDRAAAQKSAIELRERYGLSEYARDTQPDRFKEICPSCKGAKSFSPPPCRSCGGRLQITCPKCGGSGRVRLELAGGTGPCVSCKGKGNRPCLSCQGRKPEPRPCQQCNGEGNLFSATVLQDRYMQRLREAVDFRVAP